MCIIAVTMLATASAAMPAPGDLVGVMFEVSVVEVSMYLGNTTDITDQFICVNCTHVCYGEAQSYNVTTIEYDPSREMCFNLDNVIQILVYEAD